jgi:trk system potassium uptake protein TrkH
VAGVSGNTGVALRYLAVILLFAVFGAVTARLNATLTGISAQTTTGFSSLNLTELDPGSKLTLITSMLSGGELGSTAGGLKIVRLMILLSLVRLPLQQAANTAHRPHSCDTGR